MLWTRLFTYASSRVTMEPSRSNCHEEMQCQIRYTGMRRLTRMAAPARDAPLTSKILQTLFQRAIAPPFPTCTISKFTCGNRSPGRTQQEHRWCAGRPESPESFAEEHKFGNIEPQIRSGTTGQLKEKVYSFLARRGGRTSRQLKAGSPRRTEQPRSNTASPLLAGSGHPRHL